jgi:ferredoxin-NADP reductase
MAKIRQLTDQKWNGSIHLIFSVKSEEDIVFRSELDELQKKFPNLRVTVTITRDAAKSWTGERGRINEEMLKRVAPEVTKSRVHLCGPTEMTSPIIAILKNMGVPNEMIKFESFASPSRGQGPKAVTQELKPGENATLEFMISGKQASNLKGRTVLEIAEDHGVEIPYDCRSGICGQCKVQLLSGNVVMDSEDALDATESANRIILACQARCVDDVQVDA